MLLGQISGEEEQGHMTMVIAKILSPQNLFPLLN
jgi:hypothetical protein